MLSITRPLWFDEIYTAWASRLSFPDLIAALRVDSGPPGFYVFEKVFVGLADAGAVDDRILRVIPFLAAAALFAFARTLPAGVSRIVFVLLTSCSLLVNLYAGEARAYAPLALFVLALFLTALRGPETPARLAAAAAAAALAVYMHYLGIFAVGSVALLAAGNRRWRSLAAVAAGAALFLPWVPVLRAQPGAAVAWMHEGAGRSVLGFLSALGGVGRVPGPFGSPPSRPVFAVSVAAGLLAAGALAFGPARKDRDVRNAAAFTVLVLVSVLIAGLRRPVAFAGRTEMAVLPVWLWGVAVAARDNPFARAAAAATAVVGAAATAFMVASPRPYSTPLVAVERLSRATRNGDVVVAATGFYLPARLAAERGRLAARVVPLPSELSDHPGWFEPTFPGAPEEKVVAEAVASLPPGGRLFFAVPAVYATPRLFAPLGPEPQLRPLMQQPGALVAAWAR